MVSKPTIIDKSIEDFEGDTPWSFGLVNGKLEEIFFGREGDKVIFFGHAYVKKSEYKTKTELKWIEKETKRVKLSFRNGKYTWIKK